MDPAAAAAAAWLLAAAAERRHWPQPAVTREGTPAPPARVPALLLGAALLLASAPAWLFVAMARARAAQTISQPCATRALVLNAGGALVASLAHELATGSHTAPHAAPHTAAAAALAAAVVCAVTPFTRLVDDAHIASRVHAETFVYVAAVVTGAASYAIAAAIEGLAHADDAARELAADDAFDAPQPSAHGGALHDPGAPRTAPASTSFLASAHLGTAVGLAATVALVGLTTYGTRAVDDEWHRAPLAFHVTLAVTLLVFAATAACAMTIRGIDDPDEYGDGDAEEVMHSQHGEGKVPQPAQGSPPPALVPADAPRSPAHSLPLPANGDEVATGPGPVCESFGSAHAPQVRRASVVFANAYELGRTMSAGREGHQELEGKRVPLDDMIRLRHIVTPFPPLGLPIPETRMPRILGGGIQYDFVDEPLEDVRGYLGVIATFFASAADATSAVCAFYAPACISGATVAYVFACGVGDLVGRTLCQVWIGGVPVARNWPVETTRLLTSAYAVLLVRMALAAAAIAFAQHYGDAGKPRDGRVVALVLGIGAALGGAVQLIAARVLATVPRLPSGPRRYRRADLCDRLGNARVSFWRSKLCGAVVASFVFACADVSGKLMWPGWTPRLPGTC